MKKKETYVYFGSNTISFKILEKKKTNIKYIDKKWSTNVYPREELSTNRKKEKEKE